MLIQKKGKKKKKKKEKKALGCSRPKFRGPLLVATNTLQRTSGTIAIPTHALSTEPKEKKKKGSPLFLFYDE
jgi:hypothetical protein